MHVCRQEMNDDASYAMNDTHFICLQRGGKLGSTRVSLMV